MNISNPEVTQKKCSNLCSHGCNLCTQTATEELCAWSAWCNVTRDQLAGLLVAGQVILYCTWSPDSPLHMVSTTSSCSFQVQPSWLTKVADAVRMFPPFTPKSPVWQLKCQGKRASFANRG